MNGYAAGGGMRPFLLGAAGGAAVGGGVAYALLRRDRGSAAVEGKTPPGETVHPAMRLGWPTGTEDLLRVRDGFVASYDARTRNPRWVLEVLNTSTMSGPGTRKRSNFVEDATLDERFRAKLADFRGSGYDRGHLAAAAGHKNSQRAMDETFELCNISPQVGDGFNRDYWARLERFTRDVALRTKLDVLVATGPLFLPTRASQSELRARDLDAAVSSSAITAPDVSVPNSTPAVSSTDITAAAARPSTAWEMRYPLIGSPPELVAVPTHFYKVVVAAAPEVPIIPDATLSPPPRSSFPTRPSRRTRLWNDSLSPSPNSSRHPGFDSSAEKARWADPAATPSPSPRDGTSTREGAPRRAGRSKVSRGEGERWGWRSGGTRCCSATGAKPRTCVDWCGASCQRGGESEGG